ncbi:MAG: nuclear transport factor 2 family protein [Paludibacter sp.]
MATQRSGQLVWSLPDRDHNGETIMKIRGAGVVWTGLLLSCLCAGTTLAAVSDAEFSALKKRVDRQQDWQAVSNLMGARANLMVANRGDLVIELFAKKQPDVAFALNGQFIEVGHDRIKAAFGKDPQRQQRALEQLAKVYPQLEAKLENQGAGDFRAHALMSPIIEVAEDGQTAQGFWQTIGPAFFSGANNGGTPTAALSYEKYAVDFIKEDGQWKIWHLQTFIEFYQEFDKPFADQVKAAMTPRTGDNAGPAGTPPANAGGTPYPEWTPVRVPKQVPLPKPYKTFSETYSYGPPTTR